MPKKHPYNIIPVLGCYSDTLMRRDSASHVNGLVGAYLCIKIIQGLLGNTWVINIQYISDEKNSLLVIDIFYLFYIFIIDYLYLYLLFVIIYLLIRILQLQKDGYPRVQTQGTAITHLHICTSSSS